MGPLYYRATYAAPDPETDDRQLLVEAWVDVDGHLLRAAGASGRSRSTTARTKLDGLPPSQAEAPKVLAHLEIDEKLVMIDGSQRQWSRGSQTALSAGSDSYRTPDGPPRAHLQVDRQARRIRPRQ